MVWNRLRVASKPVCAGCACERAVGEREGEGRLAGSMGPVSWERRKSLDSPFDTERWGAAGVANSVNDGAETEAGILRADVDDEDEEAPGSVMSWVSW